MAFKFVKYHLSLRSRHIYLVYQSSVLNFAFRKLELNTVYMASSDKLLFKYYISIVGGSRGSEDMLILLIYFANIMPKSRV